MAMKSFFSIFLFIFFFSTAFSQDVVVVDSLKTNIKKLEGEKKVEAYCQLAEYLSETNLDSVLYYLQKAENLANEINDEEGSLNVLGNYGKYYYYKSDYKKALEYMLKALKQAERSGNKHRQASLCNNVGVIFYDIGSMEKAKDYNRKSIILNENDSSKRIYALNFILAGNIYYAQNILDSSEVNLTKALNALQNSSSLTYESKSDILLILNNLGNIYFGQKKYEKAITHFQKAVAQNDISPKSSRLKAIFLNNLAECQFLTGNSTKAVENINKSILISKDKGIVEVTGDSYEILAKIYSKERDFERALHFYKSFILHRDSVHGTKNNQKIAALQVQFETEKQSQEFAIQQKEKEISTLRIYVVLGIVLIILLLVIFTLNRRRVKFKKDKLIAIKNSELATLELTNAELDIDSKNKELENFTTQLQAKNELVEKFQKDVIQLLTTKDEKAARAAEEELINMKILSNEDWFRFKILFGSVHKGFLPKIEKLYPALTEGDKRQVIMLKLGLSVQHIADSLGISHQAVWKGRQRLAKKMGLNETKDIMKIIHGL